MLTKYGMVWTTDGGNRDSAKSARPLLKEGASYRALVQQATLADSQYNIMVGHADGMWQFSVAKDGKTIFGPTVCGSETEAKLMGHLVAFSDAGLGNHYCNGDCLPWEKH